MLQVEIRVKDLLDQSWSTWLDGFTFTYPGQEETILTGRIEDQAALYGLIAKLRDMGVKLITVSLHEAKDGDVAEGDSTG